MTILPASDGKEEEAGLGACQTVPVPAQDGIA
jgi:hypothetical protein